MKILIIKMYGSPPETYVLVALQKAVIEIKETSVD